MQHGGVPELLIGLGYNGLTGRLSVEVVKGSQFRNVALSKAPDTYVKLCLVSSMGHEMAKAKSSTRRGQPNPLFKETFIFQVALFQLNDVTLIISVYAKRNMKKNEMVGWFSLGLNSSGPEEIAHWGDMLNGTSTRTELISRWHVLVDSWFNSSPRRSSLGNAAGNATGNLLDFIKPKRHRSSKKRNNSAVAVDIMEMPVNDLDFV